MKFTYEAYIDLINVLMKNNYSFIDYAEKDINLKSVIMRHDVDYSLKKTIKIAEIEQSKGVSSTFFLMLTSDFYNVFSLSAEKTIQLLLSLGHDIGLHFDEMRYPDLLGKPEEITEKIELEADVLSRVIGKQVTKVSMHRPSKKIIEANLKMPQIINTYSTEFFKEYKYLSDSRRRWREPVLDIIKENQFNKLHILIHPFWYNDEELNLEDSIKEFVNNAGAERYHSLNENFTNLAEIMSVNKIGRA